MPPALRARAARYVSLPEHEVMVVRGGLSAVSAMRRLAPTDPLVLLLVVAAGVRLAAGQGFVIHAIQQRASSNGTAGDSRPPIELAQERLMDVGHDPKIDSSVKISRFQYVGCFQHTLEITTSAVMGAYRDPNSCVQECKSQDIYKSVPSSKLIVAVQNDPEQGRCGCALKDEILDFQEEDPGPSKCTYICQSYLNPLCGGPDNYWGIFMEYDYFSMSGQGAYDPWRYVFYSVVVLREKSISGVYPTDGVPPERYYLNAVDVDSGKARFEYQMRLTGGLLYGLQYDIDSTRLVGLYTNQYSGRLRTDLPWTYKLATILINTTNKYRPYLQMSLAPIDITTERAAVPEEQLVSGEYMAYNGASAIFSKSTNCYVFTQAAYSSLKFAMKDRVYIVRIPDGFIVREEPLDFKVTSLFANQQYGDLSAIGPRLDVNLGGGRQSYVYLARVYRSAVESRTLVDWQYNPVNPFFLADPGIIGDFDLYPGLEASEHLFNKTAIAHRLKTENNTWGVFMITEIGIRFPYLNKYWSQCTLISPEKCQGTMDARIPYASIYNREPGIPLTLKAPSFVVPARFNMDASAIIVNFDRSTLQGARPLDTDGDFVPDRIDYALQRQGPFNCGELFTVESTLKLGVYPVSTCEWKSSSTVRVSIGIVNISVGDTIFIKPDALYAVNSADNWSPAATGGVQVGFPDPLETPVIIPSGSITIDQCTPVRLVVDSLLDGGFATWQWTWITGNTDDPNPKDLANRANFVFDPTRLKAFKDALQGASNRGNKTFTVPSELLEEASRYKIMVSVTSRWNLTTNYTFTLEKLTFPSPTVYIEGPRTVYSYRPSVLSVVAKGMNSKCAPQDQALGYRWLVTGQDFSKTGIPLEFSDYPDILTTTNVLVVPVFVLEPTTEAQYNTYNFTVECYVDTEFGNVADKTARATVSIKIQQSDVILAMTTYDRLLTISDVLVLDARFSFDPDYPPKTKGLTFSGTFEFRCLTPLPERRPCWDTRKLSALGLGMNADGFLRFPRRWQDPYEPGRVARRLQASDGFLSQSEDVIACRQDFGTKMLDGGQQYYRPLFDDLGYCSDSRGVLMIQTQDFIPGQYKFTVRATEYDGRFDERDVFVEMSVQRVPRITLSILNPNNYYKFPVTQEISIVGSEDSEPTGDPRTYTWNFFVYESNPDYNPELAAEALNDGSQPYTIDEFVYVDKTGILYNSTDITKFAAVPGSANLLIKKDALMPSKQYKIRLNINMAAVTGYAEISLETAGLAPRNGDLIVEPRFGNFNMKRALSAPNWQADDSPLTYEFGQLQFRAGESEPAMMSFSSAASQVKTYEIKTVSLGTLDSTGNYTLPLYVKVCTPFFACTVYTQVIISNPPADPIAAVNDLLADTTTMDPSEAMSSFSSIMSVAGGNVKVQQSILDGLADIPLSPDEKACAARAKLLADMVSTGAGGDINLSEQVMGLLEGLTTLVADSGLVNPRNTIATDSFSALGGLMPGAETGGASQAASGQSVQSVAMGRYKAPTAGSITGSAAGTDDQLSVAARARVNHPPPTAMWNAVASCPSPFCDQPGLWCFESKAGAVISAHRCCSEINPNTLCDQPPCWFGGGSCPGLATGAPAAASGVSQGRRLLPGGVEEAAVDVPRRPRRPSAPAGAEVAGGFTERRTSSRAAEGWFDSWVDHNFPVNGPKNHEVSEHDRIRGYHGWHPDIRQRRLDFMVVNEAVSPAVRLSALEQAEFPLVQAAQVEVKKMARVQGNQIDEEANLETQFGAMDQSVAGRLQAANARQETLAAQNKFQTDRNSSQRITRIIVMRDTLCKALIKTMQRGSPPQIFETVTFTLMIGKTPDLTTAGENFSFPAPYFKRPSDSPDEPAAGRTMTGFSYIYVMYKSNIYEWSDSNPAYKDSSMITLLAMQANTKDLDVQLINPPINVFQQFDLYANAICLFWDRFAPDTAGGSWSSTGIVNDGDSCLSSHMGDMAVFIDGTVPSGYGLVDAATSWTREVWESTCIGCDTGSNLFPVTALGMMLFTMMLLILLGYVQDERQRTDMKNKKVKSRYFFDGDGLSAPLHVDDPISYSMREVNILWFWIGTTVNVAMREHALLGPLCYHETFTRPQRLLCLLALICGLLAVNAAVHSNPGHLQQAQELEKSNIMVSGILSGLLMFPIYCGLLMMFNLRPSQVKKRLIKKTYSTRELDLINDQRQKLALQSAMLPIPKTGPLPPPAVGQTTLLNLPAPLPLPPLPVGGLNGPPGMFALPPPLPGAGSGGTGMLALPGMSANMPLPPPPRYPPPPKNAKMPSPAALMPPLNFPKVGPPPTPFPALMAPDASIGGSYTNLPMLAGRGAFTPPDTGATPLQLADHVHIPGSVHMDHELVPVKYPHMQDDAHHGMAPPGHLPGSLPEPRGMPGAFTPPGMMTPPMPSYQPGSGNFTPPMPGAGVGPLGSLGHGSRQSSIGGPPFLPVTQILPRNAVPPPLFIRGQPPPMLPTPLPPVPAGPGGFNSWVPPGRAPPGFMPPVPSAYPGSMTAGWPGGAGPMSFPPIPPPPPREDSEAFVRRIKLTYMDKVTREHDKYDLLEDYDELGKDVPFFVFDVMTLMPYLAACTFTLLAIFVVLQYSVKFQKWQETYWLYGTVTGLFEILFVLELFRIVMMTLVELRKFENRRKGKAGDFLPRRVRRDDDKFQAAPPPRLWKRAVAPPQVPKGAPPAPRPAFLPKEGMPPSPQRLLPPKAPMALGPPGPGRLPVAPPRPLIAPVFSSAAMARAGALDEPQAPLTPHSVYSNSRIPGGGFITPPNGPSTPTIGPPGTRSLQGGPPRPSLPRAADLMQGGGPPGPPSPAHSAHSLRDLSNSLNQQVKAGRHAEAPPPPPAQPGTSTPQRAGGATPPPAPAAPPPSYSRPPSRPSSAGVKAPGPPPRP